MPNSSDNSAAEHKGGQDQPSQSDQGRETAISPWFGPMTSLFFLAEQVCKRSRSKREDHARLPAVRRLGYSVMGSLFRIGGIAAAFVIAYYLLERNGYFATPDHIVAAFTFVLAIEAAIQFWFIWQQMAQTNAIIDHMRLEQRAWLCIEAVQFRTILEQHEIKCKIIFNNTGETPGKIFAGTVHAYATSKEFDMAKIVNAFESLGFKSNEEYLVNPNKPINLHAEKFPALPIGQSEMIRLGDMQYHVLCRFKYLDIAQSVTEIKGFYTYVPGGEVDGWHGVTTRGNYCCFP